MKIGIDTDGVLTDVYTFNYDRGKAHFGREPDYPDKFNGYDMFDFKIRNEFWFCLSSFIDYSKHCPPREYCREVITKLRADGHELTEITARMFSTSKSPIRWYSRHMLMNWYKKHELYFDDIVFCSTKHDVDDKLAACKRLGIGIMIDDKPEVARRLSENGIKVLLFDTPYNKGVEGENIERIYSWQDVPNYIN